MPKIVACFTCGEAWRECADTAAETWDRPFGDLAQKCLQFAEGHLDRVQVRRVFGQIAKCRAARFNRLPDASSLVCRKIVDHDDILALEGRSQTLFDIGQELLSVH